MSMVQTPAHVPANLVRNFNYVDMTGETDVYAKFKKVQDDEPDIFYTPHHGGHWVVTRFEDMEYVMARAELFSNKYQTVPINPMQLPLLESDGQLHADFRLVLAPYFTPKSITNLESVSRNLTISLMDKFYDRGECEFVADFSQRMPIMILMSLLALPDEDRPYLLKISEDIVRSGDPALQMAAFGRVAEYIAQKVIPARQANPGDDIFSSILRAKVQDGRSITIEETIGFGTLLIAAGLDTVASMLGFITQFLAEHPAHRRQIVEDPSIINNALEEMMRRFHIANVSRVVIDDMDYKGVHFKAGDRILTATSFAGIDPTRYSDPFNVDFKRGDKKSLVFGRGPHQCIGSFLARTELRVFLQEWTKRIPDFEVKKGQAPVAVPGKANGMRYLPLTWRVA
ncbi:MAG: cytochrome P450 [Caulobacterales bacterium]